MKKLLSILFLSLFLFSLNTQAGLKDTAIKTAIGWGGVKAIHYILKNEKWKDYAIDKAKNNPKLKNKLLNSIIQQPLPEGRGLLTIT